MPEGDTVYRAAVMMNRALAGAEVLAFESPLPALSNLAVRHQIVGRAIERVEARGKYLLVHFAGAFTLLTHMRMHGSWHLYRAGERWRRPRSQMRVRVATAEWEAVGFGIPVAELHDGRSLERSERLRTLGPDPLARDFDIGDAVARLRASGEVPVEEALLDQRRMAGIGNVLKSEALFVARVDPYAPVSALDAATLEELVRVSQRLLRENVAGVERPVVARRSAARGTTRSADPAAQLYVYDRAGRRCRRCGTTIEYRRAGLHARATYWCPKCQVRGRVPRNHDVREEHDEHEGD